MPPRGRKKNPVLSAHAEAIERIEALEDLVYELAYQRWIRFLDADVTCERPSGAPSGWMALSSEERDRLVKSWLKPSMGGGPRTRQDPAMIPDWLIEILDVYRSAVNAERLTDQLLFFAWGCVLGGMTPAAAAKAAKALGATAARATVVEEALNRRASDDDMRCKNVYFALAKGSVARYVETSYRGMRQPLFRRIREAHGGALLAMPQTIDISGTGNVTRGSAKSGRNDRQR